MSILLAVSSMVAATLMSGSMSTSGPAGDKKKEVPPNILLIVLDDLGTDKLLFYKRGCTTGTPPCALGTPTYAATRALDSLRKHGVLFSHAYASPTCSPSRSCMLTGQYGFRTGMLNYVDTGDLAFTLDPSTLTIPDVLSGLSYESAAFGKWHLAEDNSGNWCHPIACGFSLFDGHLANNDLNNGSYIGHWKWKRVLSGPSCSVSPVPVDVDEATETVWDAEYTRTAARTWINAQTEPWFAYVAFNPPHTLLHLPKLSSTTVSMTCGGVTIPRPINISEQTYCDLVTAGLDALPNNTPLGSSVSQCAMSQPDYDNARLIHRANIEAVDFEIGQLVVGLENTVIIVIGDNGTIDGAIDDDTCVNSDYNCPSYPSFHGKKRMFELGIRVPLIVVPAVPLQPVGGNYARSDSLVHAVDIFDTVIDIAGGTTGLASDSVSFKDAIDTPSGPSARTVVYSEVASDNGWKWVSTGSGTGYWKHHSGSPTSQCALGNHMNDKLLRATLAFDGNGHLIKYIRQRSWNEPSSPCFPPLPSCDTQATCVPTTDPCSFMVPTEQLYDLTIDPQELCNLVGVSAYSMQLCDLRTEMELLSGP